MIVSIDCLILVPNIITGRSVLIYRYKSLRRTQEINRGEKNIMKLRQKQHLATSVAPVVVFFVFASVSTALSTETDPIPEPVTMQPNRL